MESSRIKISCMYALRKWQLFLPILIVVSAGFLVYFGYKEPVVEFNSNILKLKGLYGINLTVTEIIEVDTILYIEMPAIAMRTNGISLNRVHRGKFRTTKDEKIHLNIHSGVSPLIRIVEKGGLVYYINRKNAEETRQIFNKLKNNIIKE